MASVVNSQMWLLIWNVSKPLKSAAVSWKSLSTKPSRMAGVKMLVFLLAWTAPVFKTQTLSCELSGQRQKKRWTKISPCLKCPQIQGLAYTLFTMQWVYIWSSYWWTHLIYTSLGTSRARISKLVMVFSRDEQKYVRYKCSKAVVMLHFCKGNCVPDVCHKQRMNAFKSILNVTNKSRNSLLRRELDRCSSRYSGNVWKTLEWSRLWKIVLALAFVPNTIGRGSFRKDAVKWNWTLIQIIVNGTFFTNSQLRRFPKNDY